MRALLTLLGLACVLSAASLLGGCAATGVEAAAVDHSADIMTASDESDLRRRARLRLELAATYFEQGQTTVALDELKQSLLLDPSFAEAHNLRGLVYMRLNEPRLSEESFRRAIALNPRDGSALHNYGWLMCQQKRYADADKIFDQALASAYFQDKAKTLMAQGLCQDRAGLKQSAEKTLQQAYELDPANPVVGFNLASLILERGDLGRAQFYVRQINNSDMVNAESLWLGMKVEKRMGNEAALAQLGDQLRRRYPQSRELQSYQKGAYDE